MLDQSLSVITYNINYQVTESIITKCMNVDKENLCIKKLKKFFQDFPYDIILLQEATHINKYIPRNLIKVSIDGNETKSESGKKMIDSIHIIYNPEKFGFHQNIYASFTEENKDFIDRPFLVVEFEKLCITCIHSSHLRKIQEGLFLDFEVSSCLIQERGNNFRIKKILSDSTPRSNSLLEFLKGKHNIIGGDFNTETPLVPFYSEQQRTSIKTCCNRNFNPSHLQYASDHIFSDFQACAYPLIGQHLIKDRKNLKLKYKVDMISDHLPVVKFFKIL